MFRCYTFRLTESSVSLALHACLGSSPAGFHVAYLQDRHFRFSVASKDVGLMVYSLKHIISKQFDIYFHLWRDGGDKWEIEKKKWEQDEESSWKLVSHRKPRKSQLKKVSSRRKIVQDSPVKKLNPPELASVVKIGSLFCPISASQLDFQTGSLSSFFCFGNSVLGGHSSQSKFQLPLKHIFVRLKGDLGSGACPAEFFPKGGDGSSTYAADFFPKSGDGSSTYTARPGWFFS